MDKATLQTQLGSTIRKRRQALGYSQDTFADAIGMHRAYYSSIERGARNLTLSTIARVADGLSVSLAKLMADAGL